MNLRLSAAFIVLSLFISSFSCSNQSGRERKPVVQIKVESVNRKIAFGDDLTIGISVKVKDGDLKETKIFIDTVLVTSSSQSEFSYH